MGTHPFRGNVMEVAWPAREGHRTGRTSLLLPDPILAIGTLGILFGIALL